MIKLTDWETGEPVFVDKSKLDVVRRLLPSSTVRSERTMIGIGSNCILARETPEEVMLAEEYNPE